VFGTADRYARKGHLTLPRQDGRILGIGLTSSDNGTTIPACFGRKAMEPISTKAAAPVERWEKMTKRPSEVEVEFGVESNETRRNKGDMWEKPMIEEMSGSVVYLVSSSDIVKDTLGIVTRVGPRHLLSCGHVGGEE
jgi:hypothetical protein